MFNEFVLVQHFGGQFVGQIIGQMAMHLLDKFPSICRTNERINKCTTQTPGEQICSLLLCLTNEQINKFCFKICYRMCYLLFCYFVTK